jgi:hypothetical protein
LVSVNFVTIYYAADCQISLAATINLDIRDTNHQSLLEKIQEKVEDKDIDSVFETYISKTDDMLIM